jgi:hypothetical protein
MSSQLNTGSSMSKAFSNLRKSTRSINKNISGLSKNSITSKNPKIPKIIKTSPSTDNAKLETLCNPNKENPTGSSRH